MQSTSRAIAIEKSVSASAYIGGEVAAGRAHCLGFDVGTRSCVGMLDGFGTLSFLASRPDGTVGFGYALKLPFARGDAEANARTIRDGVGQAMDAGREAIVQDTLRGLGLDDRTRGGDPVDAPWTARLSHLVHLIDWDVVSRLDGARIDGRLYRALLPDSPSWDRATTLRSWAIAASPSVDLDDLDVDLSLPENLLRIAEASREARLPPRDRAWLLGALAPLEGIRVPGEGVPGVLAWLSGNPARSSVPDGPVQWAAFLDIHALRRMFEHRTRLDLPRLSEVRGHDYASLRDRISYGHAGAAGGADVWAIFEILSAPLTQFVDHVVLPMGERLGAGAAFGIRNRNAERFAYGLMAADKGLGGLWDLSNDFHARFPDVARALGKAVEGLGLCWNSGFPGTVDLGGGWTATCLTTPEELAAEGDEETGLDHCVAGYYRACIQEGLQIVSVRRDGERAETMSFSFGKVWRLCEHFARSNAPPGEGYQARFTAVGKALARHSPKGMLLKATETRLERGEYDPGRPGAVESMAEAFMPLLPRKVRSDGVDGLFARLRDAIPGMPPSGHRALRMSRLD